MAPCGFFKLLRRRFRGDLKILHEEGGDAAIRQTALQHETCFAAGQLYRPQRLSPTPAREGGLSRRAQIAHPIHHAKRSKEIALPVLLDDHDWSGTRLPA